MQRKTPIQKAPSHIALIPEVEKHLRSLGIEPPPELAAVVFMACYPEAMARPGEWDIETAAFNRCAEQDVQQGSRLVFDVLSFVNQRLSSARQKDEKRKQNVALRANLAVRCLLSYGGFWVSKEGKLMKLSELKKRDFVSQKEVRKKLTVHCPNLSDEEVDSFLEKTNGGPRWSSQLKIVTDLHDKEIAAYLNERKFPEVTEGFVRDVRREWSKEKL